MASPEMIDNEGTQHQVSEVEKLQEQASQAFADKKYDVAAFYYRQLNLFQYNLPLSQRKRNNRKIEKCVYELLKLDYPDADGPEEQYLILRGNTLLCGYQMILWKKHGNTAFGFLGKQWNRSSTEESFSRWLRHVYPDAFVAPSFLFSRLLQDQILDTEDRDYFLGKLGGQIAKKIPKFFINSKPYFFLNLIKMVEIFPIWINKYNDDKKYVIDFFAQVLPAFREAFERSHGAPGLLNNQCGIPITPAIREGFYQWYLKGLDLLKSYANTLDLKALLKREYEAIAESPLSAETNAAGMAQVRLADIATEDIENPVALRSALMPYYLKAQNAFDANSKNYLTDTELSHEFKEYYCLKSSLLPGFDKIVSLNKNPSLDNDKEVVSIILSGEISDATWGNNSNNVVTSVSTQLPADEKNTSGNTNLFDVSEKDPQPNAKTSDFFAGLVAIGLVIKNELEQIAITFLAFVSEYISQQTQPPNQSCRFFNNPVSEKKSSANDVEPQRNADYIASQSRRK